MENNSGEAFELAVSHGEKDLGVKITEDLKPHAKCKLAASKAKRAQGTLEKTFKCRSPELWKTIYFTYVRPHLEFAVKWIFTIKRIEERLLRLDPTIKEENQSGFDLDV